MKKYFIALLFGMSLMSMQTASAATLTLANFLGGSVVTAGPATTVSGTATGAPTAFFGLPFSAWSLNVSDPTPVNFNLSGTTPYTGIIAGMGSLLSFNNTSFSAVLAAGNYLFAVLPSAANSPYSFSISAGTAGGVVGNVPVPAAVWLFGSALLGLMGVGRRKSQPALAA